MPLARRQAGGQAALAVDAGRPADLGRRVVYAVGQFNFISDPAQSPHASADQLSEWLGVKKTTMANKARLIRTTLDLSRLDPEFMRRALVDSLPTAWLLQVDGLLIDIRYAPAPVQVQALQLGLIPYLPGQPPTSEEEIDRLVEVVTVDCYGLAEDVTSFYEVFAAEVRLPAEATLAGARVEVTGFAVADDGAEVAALCRRGGAVHDVRASDIVFPPETPAGWIHAAYCRCLGLTPRPSAMPAGWQPDWL